MRQLFVKLTGLSRKVDFTLQSTSVSPHPVTFLFNASNTLEWAIHQLQKIIRVQHRVNESIAEGESLFIAELSGLVGPEQASAELLMCLAITSLRRLGTAD